MEKAIREASSWKLLFWRRNLSSKQLPVIASKAWNIFRRERDSITRGNRNENISRDGEIVGVYARMLTPQNASACFIQRTNNSRKNKARNDRTTDETYVRGFAIVMNHEFAALAW